jgi:hypothetical protein
VHWKGYDASHGRWVSRASLAQDVPGLVRLRAVTFNVGSDRHQRVRRWLGHALGGGGSASFSARSRAAFALCAVVTALAGFWQSRHQIRVLAL